MSDPACVFCAKLARPADLSSDELVWAFPQSLALLGRWQFYEGYCVLVTRDHVRELTSLPIGKSHDYFNEYLLLAKAVEAEFQPLKLNSELLGNQVPHLHWHIFPRSADDPDRLLPVWIPLSAAEKDPAATQRMETGKRPRSEIAASIRRRLETLGAPSA